MYIIIHIHIHNGGSTMYIYTHAMVPCIYAYSSSEHPWQGKNSSVDNIMFGTQRPFDDTAQTTAVHCPNYCLCTDSNVELKPTLDISTLSSCWLLLAKFAVVGSTVISR